MEVGRHRRFLPQVVGSFAVLLFFAACSTSVMPQEQQGTIAIESVEVVPGSHIEFEGQSTLSDGSCLQTQLSADVTPLTWWPTEDCVEVVGGEWRARVRLGVNGVPEELSEGEEYVLRVWERGNPSLEAEPFWFDLSGPPGPEG